LQKLTSRIKIDKDERVLLFVQFEDLMKKVSEALEFRGIKHLQIAGTATKKSNTLEAFQNNANARVLLLNVIDESASGAYSPPPFSPPSLAN
jgi:SNF2 family DNA or RNA helicase